MLFFDNARDPTLADDPENERSKKYNGFIYLSTFKYKKLNDFYPPKVGF
jgi:hypothetical protein